MITFSAFLAGWCLIDLFALIAYILGSTGFRRGIKTLEEEIITGTNFVAEATESLIEVMLEGNKPSDAWEKVMNILFLQNYRLAILHLGQEGKVPRIGCGVARDKLSDDLMWVVWQRRLVQYN